MSEAFLLPAPFWLVVTRLGEAQILVPAAVFVTAMAWRRRHGSRSTLLWLGLIGLAALLTTATKLAFIGWGLGWAALDFTGISGHALFAAAVLPVLLPSCLGAGRPRGRIAAAGAGAGLALLVGVSRLVLHAHSPSEVAAGLLLGGAVSATVLLRRRLPPLTARWAMPAALASWLLLMSVHAPPSMTHSMVQRLALQLSGRTLPYTRADLHRRATAAVQPVPTMAPSGRQSPAAETSARSTGRTMAGTEGCSSTTETARCTAATAFRAASSLAA